MTEQDGGSSLTIGKLIPHDLPVTTDSSISDGAKPDTPATVRRSSTQLPPWTVAKIVTKLFQIRSDPEDLSGLTVMLSLVMILEPLSILMDMRIAAIVISNTFIWLFVEYGIYHAHTLYKGLRPEDIQTHMWMASSMIDAFVVTVVITVFGEFCYTGGMPVEFWKLMAWVMCMDMIGAAFGLLVAYLPGVIVVARRKCRHGTLLPGRIESLRG